MFRDIFGHLQDPYYVVPSKNKWIKDESDLDYKNEIIRMQKFVPIGGADAL